MNNTSVKLIYEPTNKKYNLKFFLIGFPFKNTVDLHDTLKMLSFVLHMPGCDVNVPSDYGFFPPVWN